MAREGNDGIRPPLKRHAALQPLSREHMSGLIQSRGLLRASSCDQRIRRRTADAFLPVWDAEIREHFDDEERLLLPLTREPAMRERLLAEHSAIRALADAIRQDPSFSAEPANLVLLGTLLRDHIRWEEREFFEMVQRDHPEALEALASEAAEIEQRRPGSRTRQRMSADGYDAQRSEEDS